MSAAAGCERPGGGATDPGRGADASPPRSKGALLEILRDVRFEQTLFSLPFLLLSALLAAGGLPPGRELVLILVALVAARSGAMAVNRAADAHLDARNPRTAARAIPAGRVSRRAMAGFAVVSIAAFVAAAAALNPLCLYLSPVALLFLVGYSWTKRFTALCHLALGAAIGIAPLGAWAAVRGTFLDAAGAPEPTPWLLGAAVALWVAGFDVIYACPDAERDREEGMHSIPAATGERRAFALSAGMHLGTVALLGALGISAGLGPVWWWGLGAGAGVLLLEHSLVRPGSYERMAVSFFRLNAVFSIVLLAAGAVDLFRG